MRFSGTGCACSARSCPSVGAGIISTATAKEVWGNERIIPAPNDNPRAAPNCRVIKTSIGCACNIGDRPTIGVGIVSTASAKKVETRLSAPDDHFTASPYCRVKFSGDGRDRGAGGRPTVGARIIPPAGVK